MSGLPQIATLVAALGCGLVAGTFFGFSAFVMPALDRLVPAESISAMQSINRVVLGPGFMLALFGTAVACAGLIVWAARSWDRPEAKWIAAGGALYLLGTIVVTMAGNVPLNDTLETVRPHGPAAADDWADFHGPWTGWNHVRTAAGLGAAALLTIALTVE
jgi:uncharacterized membrane protein